MRFSRFLSYFLLLVLFLSCQKQMVSDTSSESDPKQSANHRSALLAVLPFRPSSADPELRQFALGLRELTRSVLLGYERIQLVDPLGSSLSEDLEDAEKRAFALGARFALSADVGYSNGRYLISVRLTDLLENDSEESDTIEAPGSALGTVPYDITLRMDELALELGARTENGPWISRREQDLADRRFKPSFDAFEYYSNGVYRESNSADSAIRYYRKALAIEPYFREAQDRIFRLQNRGNPYTLNGFNYTTQQALVLMRRNQLSPMVVALTYQEFGKRAMGRNRDLANRWFQESNRWLYLEGRYRSAYYADNQNGIGSAFVYFNKGSEALTRFQSAYELQKELGMQGSLAMVESHLNLANAYAIQNNPGLSLPHYAAAERICQAANCSPGIVALIQYNKGVMFYIRGIYQTSIESSRQARRTLIQANLGNSQLHLATLLNINAALLHQRHYDDALRISDALAIRARSIGETNYPPYKFALHNTAFALQKQGRTLESIQARKQVSWSGQGPNRPLYETFLSFHDVPSPDPLFQTDSERQQVASYTGAFKMEYHRQNVRSRTYPGRQDDTNILLRDILYPRKRDAGLDNLRKHWLSGESDSEGSGITFIDVGPGLANVQYPAVTSRSIARDFRRMQVVALDLPEQVRLFQYQVPGYKKKELLAHQNISVLSADGRESLKKVFADPSRWPIDGRGPLRLDSGTPVAIRMANSIDIYLDWNQMEEVLIQLAADLKENPVLLCFNRSILLKKKGSSKFEIVGYVSIRGFHHNLELLDRGGDPPYTLIDDSDLNFLD
ncbi:MAG: hypothetical protein KDK23_09695 [Leptospiraceae bacterium]|nr:hypothetical protein [Leptospiraceae bacterium]